MEETTKNLLERGMSVDWIIPGFKKEKDIKKEGKLTIHSMKILDPDYENKSEGGKKLLSYLREFLSKNSIDVISAENFYRGTPPSYAFAVNLSAIETSTPLVLRMHAHANRPIEKALVKDLLWNKISGVSENVTSQAYESGVEVGKLETVHPPVDTERFKPGLGEKWLRSRLKIGKNDNVILHASRITGSKNKDYLKLKGIDTLLESFSIISKTRKNLKLVIAAATPPPSRKERFEKARQKIYDMAKLKKIENNVIVESFSLDEMPHVYNGCDIFSMASKMESFGLVYAEAMACGLPVIGTVVGGVPEVITSGEDGYLIPPENSTELAKALRKLLKSKKRREKMGRRGIEKVKQKFDLNKTVEKLLGVYKSAIYNNVKKNGQKELDIKTKKK